MSGSLGSKRAVYDVWPIRFKKFFVLVDPHTITRDSADVPSSLATIRYLLQREASVVIGLSFGPLRGIPLDLPREEREAAIATFAAEGGMGYTNFFSTLPAGKKMDILQNIPDVQLPVGCSSTPNTGKTFCFSQLSTSQKAEALRAAFPKEQFEPVSTVQFLELLRVMLSGVTVKFAPDCLHPPLSELRAGEVLLLENLQFYASETSSDPGDRYALAGVLAKGLDVYVNDSFATAHHVRASTVALPKLLLHGAAGNWMDRELAFFSKFLTHPARPISIVVAGTHVPEKLSLIRSLVGKVDRILVAGAVELPFLHAKGLSAGKGYVPIDIPAEYLDPSAKPRGLQRAGRSSGADTRSVAQTGSSHLNGSGSGTASSDYAKEILELCTQHGVELVLPIDHVVSRAPVERSHPDAHAVVVESSAIPTETYAVDCGANTIALFARHIRDCRTVFWTGTFGMTSLGYTEGTDAFACVLANAQGITIVGGQYTTESLVRLGVPHRFSHISSGGVSCMDVLRGRTLPAVIALSDAITAQEPGVSVSVNELLRNLPLFMGCDSHQLKAVSRKFVRQIYTRGDFLIYQGDRHTNMWVVAHGALVAKPPTGTSLHVPPRIVGKGHTVGMYDFISQSFSEETVQCAQDGTVTYQLSSAALNDLLNEHPDMAAQFFQNISEPLRLIASEEYRRQRGDAAIVMRDATKSRVPSFFPVSTRMGYLEDMVQDVVAAVALQKLTRAYTPYAVKDAVVGFGWASALSGFFFTSDKAALDSFIGTRVLCVIPRHRFGLPLAAIAVQVARNYVFHRHVQTIGPSHAALLSAVVTAPLRVFAMGALDCRSWRHAWASLLNEVLTSVAVGTAPLAAHALMMRLRRRLEEKRWHLGRPGGWLVAAVSRLVVGLGVFAIVFPRRNSRSLLVADGTERGAVVRCLHAFRAYELKQVLLVLLRVVVHSVLRLVASRPEVLRS